MIARGNSRRSSASRASRAAASGSGPATTVTDVAMVVISTADQTQLTKTRRLLDGDRVVVREAGVAEAVLRAVTRAVDGFVQPFQRQVAERIGADELADLLRRASRADQLLARRRVDSVVARPHRGRRADAHVH